MFFKQRCEGDEGINHTQLCKGPKSGACLVCSRKSEEASRRQRWREKRLREAGGESREVLAAAVRM